MALVAGAGSLPRASVTMIWPFMNGALDAKIGYLPGFVNEMTYTTPRGRLRDSAL